jgi:hypothetical protein
MIAMISDRRPKYRARRSAQVPHFDRSTGRLIAAHLDDGRNDNSNPAPIKPVRNGIAANSFIAIMAHLKFLNVLTSLRGLAEVMSLLNVRKELWFDLLLCLLRAAPVPKRALIVTATAAEK